jgi:hypothetical protein
LALRITIYQFAIFCLIAGLTRFFCFQTSKEYEEIDWVGGEITNLTEDIVLQQRIEYEDTEIELKVNKMTLVAFLLLRFLFAMASPFFYNHPASQVIYLITISLVLYMFDFMVKAENVESKNLRKAIATVKFLHHCLHLCLLCFTDMIQDKMFQYNIGKIFINLAISIIFLHMIIIFWLNDEQWSKILILCEKISKKTRFDKFYAKYLAKTPIDKAFPEIMLHENMTKDELHNTFVMIVGYQFKLCSKDIETDPAKTQALRVNWQNKKREVHEKLRKFGFRDKDIKFYFEYLGDMSLIGEAMTIMFERKFHQGLIELK